MTKEDEIIELKSEIKLLIAQIQTARKCANICENLEHKLENFEATISEIRTLLKQTALAVRMAEADELKK